MAKADYISYIKDCLKEYGTDRAKIWDKIQNWDKLGQIEPISFSTFKRYYLEAKDLHIEYLNSLNNAKDNESIKESVEVLKSALKSKFDRLIELQEQENKLNEELDNAIMVVHTFSEGEIVTGNRPMNSLEKASIHKTIKEIRAEISKIEGDYAPTKQDIKVNKIGIEDEDYL